MNPALSFPRDLRAETAGLVAAIAGGGFIAFAPHALVFAGVVFAAVALLTAWRPSCGLGALLLTVPIQTSLTLDIGARHLTFTKTALAAVALGWLAHLIFGGERPKLNAVSLAFIAYLCALVASMWNARNQGPWAGETYRWLTAALVYVIAVGGGSSPRRSHGLVWLHGVGGDRVHRGRDRSGSTAFRSAVVHNRRRDAGVRRVWRTQPVRRLFRDRRNAGRWHRADHCCSRTIVAVIAC